MSYGPVEFFFTEILRVISLGSGPADVGFLTPIGVDKLVSTYESGEPNCTSKVVLMSSRRELYGVRLLSHRALTCYCREQGVHFCGPPHLHP